MAITMDETPGRQPRLTASLQALAADDAASGASEAVQRRLLEEVRRLRHARRRSLLKMSFFAGALAMVTALPILHLAIRNGGGPSSSPQKVSGRRDAEMVTAFFPLPYSTVPMSGGRIVRLEVARETVLAFGVDTTETTGGAAAHTVLADVIVGDDGLARAVRFVRPVSRGTQKEQQR